MLRTHPTSFTRAREAGCQLCFRPLQRPSGRGPRKSRRRRRAIIWVLRRVIRRVRKQQPAHGQKTQSKPNCPNKTFHWLLGLGFTASPAHWLSGQFLMHFFQIPFKGTFPLFLLLSQTGPKYHCDNFYVNRNSGKLLACTLHPFYLHMCVMPFSSLIIS